MPPKALMPLCPKGVAVSKPKRDTWLVEELLDTIVPKDPTVRVEASGYPGVVLVYSSLEPWRLSKLVYSGYHSFMRRFVPSQYCVRVASLGELEALVGRIASLLEGRRLRLMVSLRGFLKRQGGERIVRARLLDSGCIIDRGSSFALAIESIDEVVVAAMGNTRRCGLDCVTISIER